MDERSSQYELQTSRNGLTVPIIRSVYLHSIYNPVKEAEAFAKAHESSLKIKRCALVFGLGFGYHIEEIAKILNHYHSSFEVIIVEPNQKLVKDFTTTRNFEDSNIKILSSENPKDFFEDWAFIRFLMQKPSIIKHDPSFNLEKDFYTHFLEYKSSEEIASFDKLLIPEASQLFQSREGKTVDSYISEIKTSREVRSKEEFLLLTLNEIRTYGQRR